MAIHLDSHGPGFHRVLTFHKHKSWFGWLKVFCRLYLIIISRWFAFFAPLFILLHRRHHSPIKTVSHKAYKVSRGKIALYSDSGYMLITSEISKQGLHLGLDETTYNCLILKGYLWNLHNNLWKTSIINTDFCIFLIIII